jgi:hypothetical protein
VSIYQPNHSLDIKMEKNNEILTLIKALNEKVDNSINDINTRLNLLELNNQQIQHNGSENVKRHASSVPDDSDDVIFERRRAAHQRFGNGTTIMSRSQCEEKSE